jgi:hypothetical protein
VRRSRVGGAPLALWVKAVRERSLMVHADGIITPTSQSPWEEVALASRAALSSNYSTIVYGTTDRKTFNVDTKLLTGVQQCIEQILPG